jgi:hypothetical protein
MVKFDHRNQQTQPQVDRLHHKIKMNNAKLGNTPLLCAFGKNRVKLAHDCEAANRRWLRRIVTPYGHTQ